MVGGTRVFGVGSKASLVADRTSSANRGWARVRVATRSSKLFCPLKGCVRRVLYVLALQVSTATATGPAAPTKGFERSKSAWRDDEETVDEEAFGGVGLGGSWKKSARR